MSVQSKNKGLLNKIVKAIKTAAKSSNKHPLDIDRADLISSGFVTDWELRKVGSLKSIKTKFFPVANKDLVTIRKTSKHNAYVKKLETALGDKLSFQEELKEIMLSEITPLPKIKQTFKTNGKKKLHREVVAMLNDTHVGVIIDPNEIGGLNQFDFREAGRRFAYFVKEVAGYKTHARHEVQKLHLILNGDLTAGIIHGLETKGIHLLIHQQNALLHILTHAISYLALSYANIEVHGMTGNHSRGIHKNHGQRAVSEVYDSYEAMVFYGLSVAFRNNTNIKFNVPITPYGFIDLPAGRALYAHGDHIFSKALGHTGSTINVKSLSTAIKDFNAGEIIKGNPPVKLLLFGHTHCFAHFITNDGVEVYVAPSLSGTDSYAHSLTINTNFVAQVVFESTPDFILGDSRLVRVAKADGMVELDSIIPEYKRELRWNK